MKNNYFHINTPYFGAWKLYNWGQGDWGIGIHKGRIDQLAKDNSTCIVSYGKSTQEYTIKAQKVQQYPIRAVRGQVKVYVVQKSALNFRAKIKETPLMEYNKYLV